MKKQCRMDQQNLHSIFIDLEKTYDRLYLTILYKSLGNKWLRISYIQTIQDMHKAVSTSVQTQGKETNNYLL